MITALGWIFIGFIVWLCGVVVGWFFAMWATREAMKFDKRIAGYQPKSAGKSEGQNPPSEGSGVMPADRRKRRI